MHNMAAAGTAMLLLLFIVGQVRAIADDRLLRTNSEHLLRRRGNPTQDELFCKNLTKRVDISLSKNSGGLEARELCNDGWKSASGGNRAVCKVDENSFKSGFTCEPSTTSQCINGQEINAMQWSPHWKCFQAQECKVEAVRMLNEIARNHAVDFLNVGMMPDSEILAINTKNDPRPYLSSSMSSISGPERRNNWPCGADVTQLFYDHKKWEVEGAGEAASPKFRCLQHFSQTEANRRYDLQRQDAEDDATHVGDFKDRAVSGAIFHRKDNTEDRFLVVAVHMPHPFGGTSSGKAIFDTYEGEGLEKLGQFVNDMLVGQNRASINVLIIGDFNYDIPSELTASGPARGSTYDESQEGFTLGRWTPQGLTYNDELTEQPSMTNEDMWDHIQKGIQKTLGKKDDKFVKKQLKLYTRPAPTCCADQKFPETGLRGADSAGKYVAGEEFFPFAFDRILSSVGQAVPKRSFPKEMNTRLPLGVGDLGDTSNKASGITAGAPGAYAKLMVGAFHKPIIGQFKYNSPKAK